MYLKKVISKKTFKKDISFLLASWRKQEDPNPDPLVRGMDPRIRIHTKMSRIRNTDKCKIFQCGNSLLLYPDPNPGEMN